MCNIQARQGDRYDIYVDDKKISGSASKYTSGKVMHHGTLLIDADLHALKDYLTSFHYKKGSIESKGIKSVRSSVTNLKNISPGFDHKTFLDSLKKVLIDEKNQGPEVIQLTSFQINETREIQTYYKKITSWDWLFGNTPGFTVRHKFILPNKELDCLVRVKKGLIILIETDEPQLLNMYLETPFEDLLI